MSTHKEKSRKKKGRRVGKEDRHATKKRTHVKKACIHCRNGHLRCDDSRPCTQCVKRNISCTDQTNVETNLSTGVKREREDSEKEENSVDGERPAKRLCSSPLREQNVASLESPLSSPVSSPKPSPLRSSARILRSSVRSAKRTPSSKTLFPVTSSPSSRPSPSPSCSVSPASSNGQDLNVSSDCVDVDINASVDNTNTSDSHVEIVQIAENNVNNVNNKPEGNPTAAIIDTNNEGSATPDVSKVKKEEQQNEICKGIQSKDNSARTDEVEDVPSTEKKLTSEKSVHTTSEVLQISEDVQKSEEIPKVKEEDTAIVHVNLGVVEQEVLQLFGSLSTNEMNIEQDRKKEPFVLQPELVHVEQKQPPTEEDQQFPFDHSQNLELKPSQVQAQEGFFFDFGWELANASTTETDSGDSDTLVQDVDICVGEMYLSPTSNSNFLQPPLPHYIQEPSQPCPQSHSPPYTSNSFCFYQPWSNSDSRNWDGDDIKW